MDIRCILLMTITRINRVLNIDYLEFVDPAGKWTKTYP